MNTQPSVMDRLDYNECMEVAREKLRKQIAPLQIEANAWVLRRSADFIAEFEETRRQIIDTYGDHS